MAATGRSREYFSLMDEAEGAAGVGDDEANAIAAGAALRSIEIEAAVPHRSDAESDEAAAPADSGDSLPDEAALAGMSIDELRVWASRLNVPSRSQITERSELIAEIRRRL